MLTRKLITCQYPRISVTSYFWTSSYFQSAYPPFNCPPCPEYLCPHALILLRLRCYTSHVLTYLLHTDVYLPLTNVHHSKTSTAERCLTMSFPVNWNYATETCTFYNNKHNLLDSMLTMYPRTPMHRDTSCLMSLGILSCKISINALNTLSQDLRITWKSIHSYIRTISYTESRIHLTQIIQCFRNILHWQILQEF